MSGGPDRAGLPDFSYATNPVSYDQNLCIFIKIKLCLPGKCVVSIFGAVIMVFLKKVRLVDWNQSIQPHSWLGIV